MPSDAFPRLQRLVRRLQEHEPAVPPSGNSLVVYGYIRTPESEPGYANACGDLLRWWAAEAHWELGAIFRDLGVGSSQLVRPGFTGLLDVLHLPDTAMAIVVERRQLSRKPMDAKRFSSAIRRTGARLQVLADELDPPP